MQPSKLSEFMAAVRDKFEQAAREGKARFVTSAAIRPFVRSLVDVSARKPQFCRRLKFIRAHG